MDENTPRKPDLYEFNNPMTRGESMAAWIYLPIHVVGIPMLMSILMVVWPDSGLTDAKMNAIYYGGGAIFMLVFLWKFLRGGYDVLIDNIRRCLVAFFVAWMLDIVLSMALSFGLMAFGMELTGSPNNESVAGMAQTNYNAVFALAVFLAPVVEEPMFRGAVFGGIRGRSRFWAYFVSVALFSLYHVWQFAVLYSDPSYLLYAVGYVPVSIALCFAYERSGSIWVPILFHMSMNLLSMTVLTGM